MLSSKKVPLEFQSNPQKYKKFHKIKIEKAVKFCPKSKGKILITQNINYMPVKQLVTTLKIVKPAMKKISRRSKLHLITWPTTILTRKPKDIRMGRGKGVPTDRVALVGSTPLLALYKTPNNLQTNSLLRRCSFKIHASKAVKIEKW